MIPDTTNENSTQANTNSLPNEPELIAPPQGLWSGEVPVGSITSPCETGRYRMVLRDYASTVQLEGSLVCLDYHELDGSGKKIQKTVLCQVAKLALKNRHHENPILGPIIREKGRIPGLSQFADQKEANLIPMDSIVTNTDIHQLPRNIPPTGTDIRFASVQDVANFSGQHKALFNIGYLYETNVPVGLMLKHFGQGDDGWGDARMLGVFGATGSGKSVMAASIIAGFAARPEMGMFIIDPQGQISGFEMGKDPNVWSWRLDEALRISGRGQDVKLVRINEIAFEDPTLFAQLLGRHKFYESIGVMGHEKQNQLELEMGSYLRDWLEQNSDKKLGEILWSDELKDEILQIGASTYADPVKQLQKMKDALASPSYKLRKAEKIWNQIREMFDRNYSLSDLLDDVLIHRKIIILNVDADEGIKNLYCRVILSGIKEKAESIYRIKQNAPWTGDPASKYRDVVINALIVIDEAQRFAPEGSGKSNDQEMILANLEDAIKTTRKLGVGWFYITQSIADFSKRIFRQIQTKVLGVGIGTGADNQHLESAFNEERDLIDRYRSLPRPISTGIYPFAVIGELLALGNGSKPLFISATKTQKELFELNPEHFKNTNGKPVATSINSRPSRKGNNSCDAINQKEEDVIPF